MEPTDFLQDLDVWMDSIDFVEDTRPADNPPAAASSAIKKRKSSKPYGQKQREELANLRLAAENLESTLEALTLRKQHRQVTPMPATEVKSIAKIPTWECIAKRQRGEKAKAEVENVKLRELIKCQLQLVKSFERLIHKSQICGRCQEHDELYGVQTHHSSQQLEEMLLDVDARFPVVDIVLLERGLSDDPMADIGDDAALRYSPTEGIHLELTEKRFMPFHYKAVDEVVWKSLSQGKLKLIGTHPMILKHTEDTVISQVILPLFSQKKMNGLTTAEMFSAMKRFQQQDRTVYVWCIKISFYHRNDGNSTPYLLTFTGSSTASSTTLPDGSSGCLVRSYTKSSSNPDVGLDREQYHQMGLLTEMVFAAYKQSRPDMNQALENLLLNDMLANNTGH